MSCNCKKDKTELSKKKDISLSKFEIGGKFECRKDYAKLDLENGVYPEYLISRVSEDGKLRIAGQIDLLVKKGNKITIADWKTNKKIETKTEWETINSMIPMWKKSKKMTAFCWNPILR